MRQFLHTPDSAFAGLKQRATGRCVLFRSQELPPSSQPDHADVGIEIESETGRALLHVQKGAHYSGSSEEVAGWLQEGTRTFPTFASLVDWIRGPLRQAFVGSAATAGQGPGSSATTIRETRHPESLTDLSSVREQIRKDESPAYIDETELALRLCERVRGQDDAVNALAASVARHCARLQPRRPAVLFAVGPTGVGKTRSAEVLANELTALTADANPYQYLRLDMSEYQEQHRVSQLIGSPQGYIGHGEGSQLIDLLASNPRCIILFDEIEKAHPAILRVLMNAMDAGRISSACKTGGGHEIDCRHAIFIFTSNLDARTILSELESRSGFGKRAVEDEVCRRRLQASGIAPEIVGRIGRFLVYRPLLAEIRAEIMAGAVAEVAAEYGVTLSYVDPSVIVELMKSAGGGNFGMRPGQFLIDELLGTAFSKAAKRGHKLCRVIGPPFRCIPERQSTSKPRPIPEETTPIDPSEWIFPQNPTVN
jgi:hypothetical protein